MPSRVSKMRLAVAVYADVVIPSYINLDPSEEGSQWFVRYDTLHYKEDGQDKKYPLHDVAYDGDYKRPEVEETIDEHYDTEEEEEDDASSTSSGDSTVEDMKELHGEELNNTAGKTCHICGAWHREWVSEEKKKFITRDCACYKWKNNKDYEQLEPQIDEVPQNVIVFTDKAEPIKCYYCGSCEVEQMVKFVKYHAHWQCHAADVDRRIKELRRA